MVSSSTFITLQDDLDVTKLMILDTTDKVFVWEGLTPTKDEKKDTLKHTMEYVKNHPDGRSKNNEKWEDLVVIVKAK